MLRGLGYVDWEFIHVILRPTLKKSKTSRIEWQPVIEKVERRLEGWQAKLLSRGGRLVLLYSVLVAILIFYLSIFKLSIGVGKRLEGLMRRFLWKRFGLG